MVGILIASHGPLSAQFVKSSEMIVGPQEHLHSVCLEPHMGLEDLVEQIDNHCSRQEKSGVLILTDLFGGTPSNAACIVAAKKNVSVVTGVNLPMLLEIVLARKGKDLKELAELAVQSGKEGIREIQLKIGEKKQDPTGMHS